MKDWFERRETEREEPSDHSIINFFDDSLISLAACDPALLFGTHHLQAWKKQNIFISILSSLYYLFFCCFIK